MNPFKTLGRWLWRWWTGREFERKALPAGVFLMEHWPYSVKKVGDGYHVTPLPIGGENSNSVRAPFFINQEEFKRLTIESRKSRPSGQTLTVGGPLPIGPGDSLNAVVGDTKPSDGLDWLKAEMLRQHMEGRQQILRDVVEGFYEGTTP